MDSKVVNFVSSYESNGKGEVQRQVGPNKEDFNCPMPLIRYQDNMGGIDHGDQMRSHFGGFATHGHYKKWYKKSALAIMDVMLLNAYIGWNMSSGDRVRSRRTKLSRHTFYTIVAQTMCSYVAQEEVDALARRTRVASRPTCEDRHYPVPLEGNKRVGCTVCLLEYRWRRKELGMKGMFTNVGRCAKCGLVAHLVSCKDDREDGWKIHTLPQFTDHTCFEILHSPQGREMFMCRPALSPGSRYKYTTKKNHPIIMDLREKHGLSPEFTRKRKRTNRGPNDMEEDDDEEEDTNNENVENDNDHDNESTENSGEIHEL